MTTDFLGDVWPSLVRFGDHNVDDDDGHDENVDGGDYDDDDNNNDDSDDQDDDEDDDDDGDANDTDCYGEAFLKLLGKNKLVSLVVCLPFIKELLKGWCNNYFICF